MLILFLDDVKKLYLEQGDECIACLINETEAMFLKVLCVFILLF